MFSNCSPFTMRQKKVQPGRCVRTGDSQIALACFSEVALRLAAAKSESVKRVSGGRSWEPEVGVTRSPVDDPIGDRGACNHRRAGGETPQRIPGRGVESKHIGTRRRSRHGRSIKDAIGNRERTEI